MSEVIHAMDPVPIKAKKLTERMAERFGIDKDNLLKSLRATAFSSDKEISNEHMIALLVVAEQHGLNPWTKEIYAFPGRNGSIIPIVGVDGWSRIINDNPAFDGMDYEYSTDIVTKDEHKPCPAWVKCIIHRKDRGHPVSVVEYLDECYQPPRIGKNGPIIGPWQTHTKRFLRHKVTIQCARIAFGFSGIYDPDEAERVIEGEVAQIDSKPKRSTSVTQTVIGEQKTTADPAMVASYVEQIRDAVFNQDDQAIRQLYSEMDNDLELVVHRKLSSQDRSYIRNAQEIPSE
jgi:phage recombination protein Bet